MRRLYFLVDDLETTDRVARCLALQHQNDWQYHVIGFDEQGLVQHHIRGASFWHKTDVIRLAEQGGLIGLVVGIIAAGFYAAFNPQLLPLPLVIWLSFILGPTLIFSWVGALLGSRLLHYRIKQFSDDLKYGRYLILIDTSKHQADALRQYLLSRVPNLILVDESSTYSLPFPSI